MFLNKKKLVTFSIIGCTSFLSQFSAFAGDVIPQGWTKAGSDPADYEVGIDEKVFYSGKSSAYIKGDKKKPKGFVTLMQTFDSKKFHGKRIRYSAYIKSKGVGGWAGLWMRIDGSNHKVIGFDNMANRPIKGTNDWKEYEIILDVPNDSLDIAFGILSFGDGQVWIDHIDFSEVESDIETTNQQKKYPENLSFEI